MRRRRAGPIALANAANAPAIPVVTALRLALGLAIGPA
jgi:hypothetical protein